jgi:hypothetical protein
MDIFTGVYCAKLLKHWAHFDRAKLIVDKSHWMASNADSSHELLSSLESATNRKVQHQ